jgi:hypothetical protein
MPASSINDQTPTKKSMEHDTGVPPAPNGSGGIVGMERSFESLFGLSLPSNAMSPSTALHPHAFPVASREASALPSPSQAGLDLPSLLALSNLNGSSLSNPLLANLASFSALNLGSPSLSSALQLQVALALAGSTNAGSPAPLPPATAANSTLEAVLSGLLTSMGQPSAHAASVAAASRSVGPRFQASAPSARSGLNGSGSGSGSGESEESLATTGNPNTIKRTGPNVTEHVYVPSSEHVAEIVGRQGVLM